MGHPLFLLLGGAARLFGRVLVANAKFLRTLIFEGEVFRW